MNNVSLIGRLTTAPELKHTQSNMAYTRFSMAVDRSYAKQGEERQTDFINIVAWGKTAEFVCKYFMKGQRIGITGEIRTGSYTAQDGTSGTDTQHTACITADSGREWRHFQQYAVRGRFTVLIKK